MYNVFFDIAAIVVTSIIAILHKSRRELRNSTYYMLRAEIYFILLTPIADIISAFAMVEPEWHPIVFEISNTIFYFNQIMITVTFLQFIIGNIKFHDDLSNTVRVILGIPVTLYVLCLLTNPLTHLVWVFNIVNNPAYVHGPLCIPLMSIPMIYFAFAYIYLFRIRNGFSRFTRVSALIALLINILSVVLEFIFPTIMFHSFGFSLALFLVYICTRNSNESVDVNTGMPNQQYYIEYVHKLFRTQKPFTLNYIRIADYGLFVSTYGLDAADGLMSQIATKLVDAFKVNEVFEITQNYFAVITINPDDNPAYQKKIKEILDYPYTMNDIETVFNYFIVGLNYPLDITCIDDLASYGHYIERMHRQRYGIVNITELELKDTQREKAVQKAIQKAVENQSFEIYYQPIRDLKTGKFTSAEALIRLTDDILGPISPGEFIPIAERNGLIIDIGNFVIRSVFNFISTYDINKFGIKYIEMNLSTIQCLQRNFMDVLYENTKDYHVDPHKICFEITETASNCAPEIFNENLDNLSKGGYLLAIDDYGSGYANLSRLMESRFDIIKFDKETTEKICNFTGGTLRIFKSIMGLAHVLHYSIVAEGVEEQKQAEMLCNNDVDYIQGYYYSKPLPEKDYLTFVEIFNA